MSRLKNARCYRAGFGFVLNGFAFADGLIRTFEGHNKGTSSVSFGSNSTTIRGE